MSCQHFKIQDTNKESSLEYAYKPKLTETNGKYNDTIEILLTFTYGSKSQSICNVSEYNGVGPAVKTNSLNHFKDPFKACTVASGLIGKCDISITKMDHLLDTSGQTSTCLRCTNFLESC